MSNEKYINHYVEILTSTLTDAVIRNVSLQANARVVDEVIDSQAKKLDELQKANGELAASFEEIKNKNISSENATIKTLQDKVNEQQNTITDLNNQVNNLNSIRREHDNVKSQVVHLESFRNELAKAREENVILQRNHEIAIQNLTTKFESVIKELNDKIEYLQLTPAKRKKLDDVNKKVEMPESGVISDLVSETPDTIRDGGSF